MAKDECNKKPEGNDEPGDKIELDLAALMDEKYRSAAPGRVDLDELIEAKSAGPAPEQAPALPDADTAEKEIASETVEDLPAIDLGSLEREKYSDEKMQPKKQTPPVENSVVKPLPQPPAKAKEQPPAVTEPTPLQAEKQVKVPQEQKPAAAKPEEQAAAPKPPKETYVPVDKQKAEAAPVILPAPKPEEQAQKAPEKISEPKTAEKPKAEAAPAVVQPAKLEERAKEAPEKMPETAAAPTAAYAPQPAAEAKPGLYAKPEGAYQKPSGAKPSKDYKKPEGAKTKMPGKTEDAPLEAGVVEEAIPARSEKPGEYTSMAVLRQRFRQNPGAFLEKLVQTLSGSQLHSGDKAFPELMTFLLNNDPEYRQENQYKLKGLENSLEWR